MAQPARDASPQRQDSGPKIRTLQPRKQGETRSIRPAQDVLARIRHDKEHYPDAGQILIGYEDRHSGIMEVEVAKWCRETEEDEWIPLHRIRYFKSKGQDGNEGKIIWDRRIKVDLVFGTGE